MKTLLAQDFPANAPTLAEMRDAVWAACRAGGCDEAQAEWWVVAINEACMNIIQHGYHLAADRQLRIELLADETMLMAILSDNGETVRLEDLRPRELDELRPGGLGVRFMRELTDTMAYLPPGDGWRNRLQMTKRLK